MRFSKRKAVMVSVLAVFVLGFVLAAFWGGHKRPCMELLCHDNFVAVMRVRVPQDSRKYKYELVVRHEIRRLTRAPSTQPEMISAVQYADLVGDGELVTTSVKDETIPSSVDGAIARVAGTAEGVVDFSFVNPEYIGRGINAALAKQDVLYIGIGIHGKSQRAESGNSTELELPRFDPGSMWWDWTHNGDWKDDELPFTTFSGTLRQGDEKTLHRYTVVLVRHRK